MDEEAAEKCAKFLANFFENELKEFLQKNPIEKVEAIKKKLVYSNNPLYPMLGDLIDNLKKFESQYVYNSNLDMPQIWESMEQRIWFEINSFHQIFLQDFIYFSVIQILFNSSSQTLNDEYRKKIRAKSLVSS